MSNFPGENLEIPKRLLEALSNQPLNHLVPKADFSSTFDSSLVVSMLRSNKAFNAPSTEMINPPPPITFDAKEEHKLVFKRPGHLRKGSEGANEHSDMYEGLSVLARGCLAATSCQVSSNEIKGEQRANVENLGELKTNEYNDDILDLNVEPFAKRLKVGSTVTVNRTNLGEKYIQDLDTLLKYIGRDFSSAQTENLEYWMSLAHDKHILTEGCLAKLQISLKNIISIPSSWDCVQVEWLLRLLEVLVDNIEFATSYRSTALNDDVLNRIAHASTVTIFTIFLIEKNDKRLLLERFVYEPINFISSAFEYMKGSFHEGNLLQVQISLFQQSISLLPFYIEQRPFLDESLIAKLVYLFSNLLMDNTIELSNNLLLQSCRDNIKLTSKNILVIIFSKFIDQREFIIDELLSHVDKLPLKRIQKRLRKIDNEVYVTDFTITIILMLEKLSCLDYITSISSMPLSIAKEKYSEESKLLEAVSNRLTNTILDKFYENPSKYRHVLDNYVQDLITLLPFPQWVVSQDLLSLLTKKLLTFFTSSHQKGANIETTCLQVLGSIGSAIFEIKCSTRPNEANNLIKLFNYPENLPQFLKSFEHCLIFCLSKMGRRSAAKYLWYKRFGALLELGDYTINDEVQNENTAFLTLKELQRLPEIINCNSKSSDKNELLDVRSDYYSILNALELTSLYEPYLRLVLSLLGSEKIKIKSTAIKCLSMLACRDQTILSSSMVKKTIERTLGNASASVKDAILDLVSVGSVYLHFYQQINANYDDESILVRKHVLKINEKIYDESTLMKVKIFVATKILLKIEDEEDSIIEMSRQVLLKRWIYCVADVEDQPEMQEKVCKEVITVMSGVAMTDEKCAQHFEWYLNFFLLNRAMHATDIYEKITRSLNLLIDFLVQEITELHATDLPSEKQVMQKRGYLHLLAKFGDCSVSFISRDHIIALYPYLVSDEKSDLQYHILHVFKNSLKKLSNFKPKFLYDLETTLLGRLPRMNVKEMEEAIPIIWSVATQRGDTARVTKACSSCFQHLSPYIYRANKQPEDIDIEGKLQRLIYLATGFARFCTFNNRTEKPLYVNDEESVYTYVAKCLLVLSRAGIPHVIRRVTIKNLAQLCGNHPKLFNSKHILNLLDEEFEGNHLDIQLVVLESLYDFFTSEERKSIRKAGVNGSISSNKALKVKVLKEKRIESVNDGVCSALTIRFLKSILRICLSPDIKSSLVAFRLLKLILQYGYTNPSHCIPTIIGLTASTNEYMSYVAVKLLKEMLEKYETMVFSGISQGVKVAIEYSKTLEGSHFYKNVSFLHVLQSSIGAGKKNSSKFLRSITKVLQVYFNRVIGAHADVETKDAILFLTSNISLLLFFTQHQLVSLMRSIDLESEHSREAVIDELEKADDGEVGGPIKNTFIIQLCLQELRTYLFHLYGLKSDTICFEGTEDSESKNKILPIPNTQKSNFVTILDHIIEESKSGQMCSELFNGVKHNKLSDKTYI